MKVRFGTVFLCVLAIGSGASYGAQGEYWELSSKMEMPGMPFAMPATTTKVCIPKGGENDPKYGSDKECVVSDVKNSGNKTSWKVRCDHKGEIMNGSGEMSGNADKSEGTIRLNGTSGGSKIEMTQTYSNKRIGGACDTEEMGKKITAQVCDTSGFDTTQWIYSAERFIKDSKTCPGKKEMACDVVRKEAPRDAHAYTAFLTADKNNGGVIAKGCAISMEATTKAICKTFSSNVTALSAHCPAEAKAYRENERRKACEGRSYTAKEDLSKCLTGKEGEHAAGKANPAKADAGAKQSPDAPAPADAGVANPAGNLIDGAKKLKGLFGF